jgi:DNA-binding GntR family transcriptional regulator
LKGQIAKSSAEHIYDVLSLQISNLMIPMGQRLTEEGLSKDFGVSRTPVREALRTLELAGYVEKESNRGYRVRTIDLETADEIYTVRTALEILSVRLAGPHSGSREFAQLKRDVEASIGAAAKQELNDPDLLATELREGFHERLASISGNSELERLLRDIDARIHAFRRLDSAVPDRAYMAQKEHLKILELMEQGDLDAASSAMEQHIARSRSTVQSLLKAGVQTISFSPDGHGKN